MKAGITGLPFSGKTTLFCALTGKDYGELGHGKDVHIGTIKVPDERLDRLYDMFQPKKKTPTTLECFDIAGQPGGSSQVMEPKSLQAMKNADSLIVVLDAFTAGTDPRADLSSLLEELAFNDLVVVSGRLERIDKELRSGKKEHLLQEQALLEQCRDTIENGGALRELDLDDTREKLLRGYQFLSRKPLAIVLNIAEDAIGDAATAALEERFADVPDAVCTSVCAEIEKEIVLLDEADRADFLASMGIGEPARGRLIRLTYENLGLISFFTAGGQDEVRAWTVPKGASAPEAAGAIHSDMERGFIRAEVIAYEDLMDCGSFRAAREKGLLRIEGKDYVVKDGDILTIRFSV